MFNQGKREDIVLQTPPKPDYIRIGYFKEDIKKYLKKGYKLDGDLVVRQDGSYLQRLYKIIN